MEIDREAVGFIILFNDEALVLLPGVFHGDLGTVSEEVGLIE